MNRRHAVAAVVVIATASIAACIEYTKYSTTEQEAVVVSPTSVMFGNAVVGSTTPAQTITLSPASGSGNSDDTVMMVSEACADFAVDTTSLPAMVFRHCGTGTGSPQTVIDGGGEKQPAPSAGSGIEPVCETPDIRNAVFPVTFSPQVAGARSCLVTFSGTFGTHVVNLSGTGTLPPLAIQALPDDVNIGDVRITTQSRLVPLQIRNIGSQPLMITSVVLSPGIFNAAGNMNPHVLAPGAADVYQVSCTPPVVGPAAETLTINSNAANKPNLIVPLACNGIDSDLVANPPSPVDFDTRVNDPLVRDITITNTGTASSQIDSILATGSTELTVVSVTPPTNPLILLPGGIATVRVRYSAASVQAKDDLGQLEITHDAGKKDNIILSASALAASLAANPDGFDFGPTCANTTKAMPIEISANSAGGFDIDSVALPAAPFMFQGPAMATVMGGGTPVVTYNASVTPTALGVATDTVTITTDIPGPPAGRLRDLVFTVEGLPEGVSASPAAQDFGTVNVGDTTLFKTVKLTNCEAGPLAVSTAQIQGEDAGDFAIVGPQVIAMTLDPTASEELLIIMSPKAAGGRNAQLVIFHNGPGGITTADLNGTAIGDGDGETDPRETYYSCSAGSGAGLVMAFALLLLVRRRRR